MIRQVIRCGNRLALMIDRLLIAPVRDRERQKMVAEIVAEAHERYGVVFERLAG
jgi:hypothetical protein